MSRTFVDDDLRLWEVYPSGGKYGLPVAPKIVFHCMSDAQARPRYLPGAEQQDEAEAADWVSDVSDDELRNLLRHSREIS